MLDRLPPDWRAALNNRVDAPPLEHLQAFLACEVEAGKRLFPAQADWFRALELTPLAAVRVVILGQDPYHGEGQAHGLAFSVPPGVRPPPSLVNIFKELEADLGLARPHHGLLEHWARQGVLLLNTVLTVELATAGAHQGRGWEALTDAIIRAVDAQGAPGVFVLWGAHAQKKAALVQSDRHLVLQSPHPSPLSARRGFFGSRPFSRANAFLEANGRGAIDWRLP
ncbi:uracil-DNA glycosylase [Sphingomonas aracearum]|uniref:Uracil-DNA glycosylase n=1 Tax=Sphingomonas aracearum TaxID=2283317 RepID=A0A369VRR6_9SPHN|nr:uracil-DNA glycosylase [Sphingomonas aracearum]RDE04723.1 uracil-DNA glycosylase [Sphingomonas aracearum]